MFITGKIGAKAPSFSCGDEAPPPLWTHSYFVSTVGGAPLAMIKQYIEGQKAV